MGKLSVVLLASITGFLFSCQGEAPELPGTSRYAVC
jgi:hypothetical protein